jgi:hypothetical protein
MKKTKKSKKTKKMKKMKKTKIMNNKRRVCKRLILVSLI